MSAPELKLKWVNEQSALYSCIGVNLNDASAFAMVGTVGYTVGSVHVIPRGNYASGTTFRVAPIASNDPIGVDYEIHPDGSTLSLSSKISIGLALDYAYFGFQVMVAEGAAMLADVHVVMRQ